MEYSQGEAKMELNVGLKTLPNRKKLVVIGPVSLASHRNFDIIRCTTRMEHKVNWKSMDFCIVMLKNIAQLRACIKRARALNCKLFICVVDNSASESAILRQECFQLGANMLTNDPASVSQVLDLVGQEANPPGPYICPYCKMANLTEDDLWTHCPLYHINQPKSHRFICPICKAKPEEQRKNFQVHLRNKHGPVGRGEINAECRVGISTHAFALVVCRRPKDNKFLVVQEFADAGFWLPGGMADPGETLLETAVRETLEEAGVHANIIGMLRIEHSVYSFERKNHHPYNRMRVIFYAEPVSDEKPKSVPDYESAGACWIDVSELEKIKLRGSEPQEWFPYVLNGGVIYPVDLLECWKHDRGRGRKQTATQFIENHRPLGTTVSDSHLLHRNSSLPRVSGARIGSIGSTTATTQSVLSLTPTGSITTARSSSYSSSFTTAASPSASSSVSGLRIIDVPSKTLPIRTNSRSRPPPPPPRSSDTTDFGRGSIDSYASQSTSENSFSRPNRTSEYTHVSSFS